MMAPIRITLMPQPDGRLHVLSDDEPGLVLSGPAETVMAALWPALTALRSYRATRDEMGQAIDRIAAGDFEEVDPNAKD